MELAEFGFLLTDVAQEFLNELAETPITPDSHLSVATRLRRYVTPEQANAILETALLRQHATAKFSRAHAMYFTRPALEQASGEIVSHYRAERFAANAMRSIADLACGIGGDALALASSASVIGVDRNPLRLRMARENVSVYGHGPAFMPVTADLHILPPIAVDAIFLDPSRRNERGIRLSGVSAYEPPLPIIERWLPRVRGAAAKISPAVDYGELPSGVEVEFISVNGDVKEALLWYGELRTDAARRATLLPGKETLTSEDLDGPIATTQPGAYLYEPDGAVIRAHLVEGLGRRLGATKIDDGIAYLTADQARSTPYARCFAIEAALPFQLKRLRQLLRSRGVGNVVVKKRGSPIAPEDLVRQLRLKGDGNAIVFLTQVQGEPYAIVAHEVAAED